MDHQEKELLEIIEGTTVAYRKKGPQVLLLEDWNKEAVLNEDSSSAAITPHATAFVADWDSIPEVYSPSAIYDELMYYFGHWSRAMFEKSQVRTNKLLVKHLKEAASRKID
ncbi:hypothetical protein GcM1_183011 [Golovinomyces cichoracearum]|uniref:Uncharacterized protein n=1 Tax=Golovinomyces cichoracearum TaxID=62708 RepID=A0A420J3M2_9PEZI|nr:hypothetical protein GcM1_183011 [Golovinomyces cichoracearum]